MYASAASSALCIPKLGYTRAWVYPSSVRGRRSRCLCLGLGRALPEAAGVCCLNSWSRYLMVARRYGVGVGDVGVCCLGSWSWYVAAARRYGVGVGGVGVCCLGSWSWYVAAARRYGVGVGGVGVCCLGVRAAAPAHSPCQECSLPPVLAYASLAAAPPNPTSARARAHTHCLQEHQYDRRNHDEAVRAQARVPCV